MRKDYAVFILSHGRANNMKTLKSLKDCGYTGKIYIIIDNEDKQRDLYEKLDCTKVIIFDKKEEMKKTDTIDNYGDHRLVVYARNKCHDIAKELGLTYFLVLDDDYTGFYFRYGKDGKLKAKKMENFDEVVNIMIKFLDETNALSVAFSQAGDLIGGINNDRFQKGLIRKAMNSFFCRVDRPFKFLGSTNEDCNAYTLLGVQGKLFFTVMTASLVQLQTQQNEGGLTDIYLDNGTYVKSFYTVICAPSCAKIAMMGEKHYRIHHKILWNNCTPKILNERYKK